mgnify:CR=1 FL=1
MIGGVMFFMTLTVPNRGSSIYTAWVLIVLEVIMYIILCYSQPGIPEQILKRARMISNGESLEEYRSAAAT